MARGGADRTARKKSDAKKTTRGRGRAVSTPAALARDAAALRRALEPHLKKLRALRSEGARGWDELWETVDTILSAEPPLWRGLYASEAEFIRKELPGETPRSVKRNVLVARTFTPADEAALGTSVLEELALYLMEREGLKRPPPHVDLDRVVVLVPHGKETLRIPARAADVQQIRAARRALKKAPSRKPASPAEKAIRTALRASKGLSGVAVRVAGGAVSLSNIPVSELRALGRALASLKLSSE